MQWFIDKKYLVKPYYTWNEDSEIPEKLHTIWGNAKLDYNGYWWITTRKEGYPNKYVHRLIYEAEHGLTLSPEDKVHHIDENPLNNHIDNLQVMSQAEHIRLHKKGEKLTDEHKQHISESLRGREFTDEHKERISESLKKNFPRKKLDGHDKKRKQIYAAVDHEGNRRKRSIKEETIVAYVKILIIEWKYARGFL